MVLLWCQVKYGFMFFSLCVLRFLQWELGITLSFGGNQGRLSLTPEEKFNVWSWFFNSLTLASVRLFQWIFQICQIKSTYYQNHWNESMENLERPIFLENTSRGIVETQLSEEAPKSWMGYQSKLMRQLKTQRLNQSGSSVFGQYNSQIMVHNHFIHHLLISS